ncbi:uncharacterized protein ARMOST_21687 [Armillaria ostoyae]|uniref:Uncharacterized protein n=1 Tax=Armillaria ostoyae TaxID=47428 RepID=A0A284SAW9_ARMOS|nr:uncharacterized protein ARMOST_21687 [Armillaria ostoyae]
MIPTLTSPGFSNHERGSCYWMAIYGTLEATVEPHFARDDASMPCHYDDASCDTLLIYWAVERSQSNDLRPGYSKCVVYVSVGFDRYHPHWPTSMRIQSASIDDKNPLPRWLRLAVTPQMYGLCVPLGFAYYLLYSPNAALEPFT